MPDAYTTTGHQVEMSCAECRGVFYGVERNLIGTTKVGDKVAVLAMCDNCLRETGRLARG